MAGVKNGGRNYTLDAGLTRFSRARLFTIRGMAKRLKNKTAKKPKAVVEKYVTKKIGGAKNGGERKVLIKKSVSVVFGKIVSLTISVSIGDSECSLIVFQPKLLSEDRAFDKPTYRVQTPKKITLKKSITPGTVLIVLAGRHKGKRVVFLKQLEKTGLLLVTGEYERCHTHKMVTVENSLG